MKFDLNEAIERKYFNNNINEDSLHKSFKKDYKNQYKDWDKEQQSIEKEREREREVVKDTLNRLPIDKDTKDSYLNGIDKKYDKKKKPFNLRQDNRLEKSNYPFYVTHYVGTSYYHPEEGGYYQAGRDATSSVGFNTLKDAEDYLKSIIGETVNVQSNVNLPTDDDNYWENSTEEKYEPIMRGNHIIGAVAAGKYIGEDDSYFIEKNKKYLSHERGYEPYQ